jgi:DNA-binding NtrC family response regulator
MSMGTVLIVDDKDSVRESLTSALEAAGYTAVASPDGADALAKLRARRFDLVVSDLKMPKMDGMELLRASRELHAPPAFIMITAHGAIRDAVEAKDLGAFDFIEKPFDLEELEYKSAKAIGTNAPIGAGASPIKGVVGASPALLEACDVISRVADAQLPVLFTGESGTGRRHLSAALHNISPRADKPLVTISCAGDDSHGTGGAEALLFGTGHGAGRVKGALESASGGSVLLVDVDALPAQAQYRLLRALEQKSFEPGPGAKPVALSARVLATTSKDLHRLAADEKFRDDLNYRLSAVTVNCPPLREMRESIPALVAHFLAASNTEQGRKATFTPRAATLLREYVWPGNVRELASVVDRCVAIAAGGMVTEAELPENVRRGTAAGANLTSEVEGVERAKLLEALEKACWNQTHAAHTLGIGRTSLQYKMQKHGLRKPD